MIKKNANFLWREFSLKPLTVRPANGLNKVFEFVTLHRRIINLKLQLR